MLRLVIDDLREFNFPVKYARTSKNGIHLLKLYAAKGQTIDELWLDHDLGGDDTIYPVIHFLEEKAHFEEPIPIDVIYIHTSNPVGRQMMKTALDRYYPKVYIIDPRPFLVGEDTSRPNPGTVLSRLCGYDD